MSTYSDKDFQELKDVVEENNQILKKLQRRATFSTVFTFIKWIVIIGIAIGAFTLIQPYLQQILESYKAISEGVSSINQKAESVSDKINISDLFKSL